MGECELLVFTLIGLFESCKEDHLKLLIKNDDGVGMQPQSINNANVIKKICLDETKILKKSTKYYKNFHSNLSISNLIINYFNIK